jgi:hypothetical protein
MSNTKQAIKARVLSCKFSDFHETGYRFELWFETPYGSWLGFGSPADCKTPYPVGEIVTCALVEVAKPPDYAGLKNDCTNWYKVL